MRFNPKLTILQNVKLCLALKGKSLEDMAQEVQTTIGALRTRLYAKCGGKKPSPLDRRILDYIKRNCKGFYTQIQRLS